MLVVLCLTTIGGLSCLYPPHNAIASLAYCLWWWHTTPLFLLALCLTIIGGLELFASIYVNTPGAGLLSLVVVDAHHPFAIKDPTIL